MVAWQVLQVEDYQQWREDGRVHTLVDVREDWEVTTAAIPNHRHIRMAEIPASMDVLRAAAKPLVIYCHAGIRSAQVASFLASQGFDQLYNLAGGIEAWSCRIDPQIPRY